MFEKNIDVSVVTPIFNEEEIIPELFKRLTQTLENTGKTYELIFVDDGSRDGSPQILRDLHNRHQKTVRVLRLSRNFGHQLAITAGMTYSHGQATVVIDGDLQDPPEVIAQFIQKWQEGYEVVYGVRQERKGESYFKKFTAGLFYKLIRIITNIDIPANAGDFYLLDRKVVNAFNTMQERHRFIRGMVAWLGFKRLPVTYVREARFAGQTKYTLWKMVKFSFDAATSFSFAPLRLISGVGAFISMLSFLYILYIFYQKFFTNQTITGWASLMTVILFLGGIQLLAIGIIGEYIARIGDDVKRRPLYTVDECLE